jgi:hypothetical protein
MHDFIEGEKKEQKKKRKKIHIVNTAGIIYWSADAKKNN